MAAGQKLRDFHTFLISFNSTKMWRTCHRNRTKLLHKEVFERNREKLVIPTAVFGERRKGAGEARLKCGRFFGLKWKE